MKRVLVAGATGYLGRFVTQEFRFRVHLVRALARSPEKLKHLQGSLDEIDVGGPRIPRYRQVAELAFQTLGKPARITVVPVWVMRLVNAVVKIFSKHQGELLAFFTTAMTSDVVAPSTGAHTLEAHFRELCLSSKDNPT